MKQKHSRLITVGIPSIFLIFCILCLVILSLLTLGTSRQDLKTAERSLEQTTAYYNACSQATELYNIAADYIQKAIKTSDSLSEYCGQMESFIRTQSDFRWSSKEEILSFTVPISDSQALLVDMDASWADTVYRPAIFNWNTISTGTWVPDTRQKVYKGENK
ncbi:MAG: hypothetical protein PUI16_10785 [Clostridia bacterium]|nr:hypothetical protein [Clostridia bacterium]MDY5553864.1 hypothetical protein [Blautia sp.]